MTASEQQLQLLEVRDLRIRFGRDHVVRGLDLEIAKGEALGLIGSSGSGKSLTARALMGLAGEGATVDAERMRLGETDLLALSERQLRKVRGGRIGLVLQDALVSLDPARTIGAELDDAIKLHSRASTSERRERALELLTRVGLPEPEVRMKQRAGALSGGQRQRALIAIALAGDPELLIADEPTTALDAGARRDLLALLRSLADDGLGILFVSHDLASVRILCDRVAVIDDGRIVETAATERILTAPDSAAGKALVEALPQPPRARPPHEGPILLAAEGLERKYRRPDGSKFTALQDASLELRAGETLGVVGASGSGKSTLARLLLALDPPDAGSVTFDGAQWSPARESARRPRRHLMGMVAQDPLSTFDPRLRVGAILADAVSGGRVRSSNKLRPRLIELLEEVGLGEQHLTARPIALSGGERQRVAIARALAGSPSVLICDEAVSALDATVRRSVLDLIDEIRRERALACIFISHDLDVVGEIADRVAVVDSGRIVETALTLDLFTNPQHPASRTLLLGRDLEAS
ncbi:ATP-binding cassette domain-containing protein [Gulosibacter molinativorax]|uniref:ABC transporter ATP-binding protein n=1 Tax=Gulosibacter molinativorax TaxID=256821 RepID=A0ABT7CAF5_9MICO|nr:ABC transporter ATP-binding protein [Gulosibacter molinativorax]MDJ1372174.1 ABC transporter ATP-binding protein [Gulosibacter molinativorax]QUY60955.1 ABC transporter ATP-binding protein [Gulosibacter molinativorax]